MMTAGFVDSRIERGVDRWYGSACAGHEYPYKMMCPQRVATTTRTTRARFLAGPTCMSVTLAAVFLIAAAVTAAVVVVVVAVVPHTATATTLMPLVLAHA